MLEFIKCYFKKQIIQASSPVLHYHEFAPSSELLVVTFKDITKVYHILVLLIVLKPRDHFLLKYTFMSDSFLRPRHIVVCKFQLR